MMQQINAADDLSRHHFQMHFCRRFKNENKLFLMSTVCLFHFFKIPFIIFNIIIIIIIIVIIIITLWKLFWWNKKCISN